MHIQIHVLYFSKIKKIPQILQTKHKKLVQQQVQLRLRHSPRNSGTNFCTQVAQHLIANHLLKLPHAFHIYNKKGKKKTIDTFLIGGDNNTWWKEFWNELGRLTNGIDSQLIATSNI